MTPERLAAIRALIESDPIVETRETAPLSVGGFLWGGVVAAPYTLMLELLDEIDRLRTTYEPVHEPMDFVNPAEIAAVRLWNERKLREAQSPDTIE